MPLVTAQKAAFLNRAFRNVAMTVPSSIKFHAYSVSPAADGTGGTEVTGNGIATPTLAWGAAAGRQVSNNATASVGTATADWAPVGYFLLADQAGGPLAFGPASPVRTILNGQGWVLQVGEVQMADQAFSADTFLADRTVNGLYSELTGGAATTFLASPFWALLTAPHTSAGTGGTEVSSGGGSLYARVAQACSAAAGGSISPSGSITFAAPAADWGLVTHLAAFDAGTAGHLIAQAKFTTAFNVLAGSPAPTCTGSHQFFTLT